MSPTGHSHIDQKQMNLRVGTTAPMLGRRTVKAIENLHGDVENMETNQRRRRSSGNQTYLDIIAVGGFETALSERARDVPKEEVNGGDRETSFPVRVQHSPEVVHRLFGRSLFVLFSVLFREIETREVV